MKKSVEEILENVIWLAGQYDDEALVKPQNLPFLELAKNGSSLSHDGEKEHRVEKRCVTRK